MQFWKLTPTSFSKWFMGSHKGIVAQSPISCHRCCKNVLIGLPDYLGTNVYQLV